MGLIFCFCHMLSINKEHHFARLKLTKSNKIQIFSNFYTQVKSVKMYLKILSKLSNVILIIGELFKLSLFLAFEQNI